MQQSTLQATAAILSCIGFHKKQLKGRTCPSAAVQCPNITKWCDVNLTPLSTPGPHTVRCSHQISVSYRPSAFCHGVDTRRQNSQTTAITYSEGLQTIMCRRLFPKRGFVCRHYYCCVHPRTYLNHDLPSGFDTFYVHSQHNTAFSQIRPTFRASGLLKR